MKDDLLEVLNYVQPDEEKDVEHLEEGNSFEHHIIHPIRRLRTWLEGQERPAFPEDGVCSCGGDDWLDVEKGYVRMSSASYEDGTLSVFMDGWDDMGGEGDEQYVSCAVCFKEYESPENVSYG